MSGVRRTLETRCAQCGTAGVVELGMLVTRGRGDSRDFECPQCGLILNVGSDRHILEMKWHQGVAADAPGDVSAP